MEPFDGPWHAAHPTWRADLRSAVIDPEHALRVPGGSTDGAKIGRAERVIDDATAELDLPWATLPASLLARIHRDGDRDAYEQVVFERQHRLTRAVLAAVATQPPRRPTQPPREPTQPPRERFVDAVADGVLLLCEQSTWCWPAHDDAIAARGWVLPDPDRPYLDLGAGEVAAQLAWIDAALASDLDERWPGLRERIRREVDARVITPFLARRDWHWLGLDGDVHNWNPWIHGNVLTAALRLLDPSDPRRLTVIELCVEGIDRYLAVLPADGAIDEGYGYWWNGACRAIEALDLLRHATGGALDAAAVPVLRATVTFPRGCHLGGDWLLNLADGQARPAADMPWHALFRGATWLGDPSSAAFARSRHDATAGADAPPSPVTAGLGRALRALADPAWVRGPDAPIAPIDADADADHSSSVPVALRVTTWWPSVQVLSVAPTTPGGLGLTIKGGHNGEHHNHLDVGSVIVDAGGVPVIIDVGRPTYTAATFGPDRYEEWCLTSPWHSVPTIAGRTQGVGPEYAARGLALRPSEGYDEGGGEHDDGGAAGLALDLAGAYPGVSGTWLREAELEPGGHVRISDAWEIDAPDGVSDVHYVLAGDVRRDGPNALTIREGVTSVREGVTSVPEGVTSPGIARLTWTSDVPLTVTLERQDLTDPLHQEVWGDSITRLTLASDSRRGRIVVVVDHNAHDNAHPQRTIGHDET